LPEAKDFLRLPPSAPKSLHFLPACLGFVAEKFLAAGLTQIIKLDRSRGLSVNEGVLVSSSLFLYFSVFFLNFLNILNLRNNFNKVFFKTF